MSEFKGVNAVITGSTTGIGLGIAEGLAASGMNVVINGLGSDEDKQQLSQRIETEHGVNAPVIDADLTRGSEARALIEKAVERLGQVDVLVNNAGVQHVSRIEEFPEEKWDQIINLNLSANFHTSKAALPGMRQHGYGRIINIASAHGLVASPYKSAYVAAKHGVVGLTRTLGLEVAEEPDLTANAICPAYVRTPLVEGQIADQAKAHNMSEEQVIRDVILAAQPNKRFVTIDELVAFTRLLCSYQGRSFNGAALPMDGAWTAR